MFSWLKSCLALSLFLSLCASTLGVEPMKSALVGNRAAVYDAPVTAANHTSVLSSNNNATPCEACSGSGCESCSSGGLHHSRMSCGSSCGGACGAGCGKHGCGHHCNNCDGYYCGHFYSRCNMIPHVAYINPMKSYYYFRPYQAFHVREQQNEVLTYGGDPRDPYANLMFHSIYPELEAAWAEEAAHNGSPFEDEVPQPTPPSTEEEKPADAPVPDSNTSTYPKGPVRIKSQNPPAVLFEKPANNTAALPTKSDGTFRSHR